MYKHAIFVENLLHLLLIMLIDFGCRQGLNSGSFIQPSEILSIELTITHYKHVILNIYKHILCNMFFYLLMMVMKYICI